MAQPDSVGEESLLKASSDCKLRLVRLLIDGGTEVNLRNSCQETPLILACKSENTEKEKVVEYLIKHRVKVNLQDVDGKTALMHACITNSSDHLIRMLVNAKANPWVKDSSKNTAFDYAINVGNIGTVKIMIEACRTGKFLSKPGSFNIEIKRLEDRLDELPEIRKCSWPLMGPRNTLSKEKKVFQQSELLAVEEDDERKGSPSCERRRKKSICHFDPIDVDSSTNEANQENTDTLPNTLRKSSMHSVGRSLSEDERISLHFSDSDSSSFDLSSGHFPSLEKLIRLRDSVTSSFESNESVNVPTCASFINDMTLNIERNELQLSTAHEKEKLVPQTDAMQTSNEETKTNRESSTVNVQNSEVKMTCPQENERKILLRDKLSSPSAPRRITLGALPGRPDDMKDNDDVKTSRNESQIRRATVSTMESSSLANFEISSPEVKLNRKKRRPLEVDTTPKLNFPPEKGRNTPSDTVRSKTTDLSKADFHKPLNLPIISHPDRVNSSVLHESELVVRSIEKTSVRRTLSDSMCQSKRAPAMITRGENRLGVTRHNLCTNTHPESSSVVQTGNRERSASSPMFPLGCQSPMSDKRALLTTRCDVVSTTAGRDGARNHGSRYTLVGDLPDLVLPFEARACPVTAPVDVFKNELQVNDSVQRLSRSVSPEILSGSLKTHVNQCKSNSFSHLPEVVSCTTGDPKEKRGALLPPLNIAPKPYDVEEGYFSCSPSPHDSESPNRSTEKSRYSFKPLSPRLATKSIRSLLP